MLTSGWYWVRHLEGDPEHPFSWEVARLQACEGGGVRVQTCGNDLDTMYSGDMQDGALTFTPRPIRVPNIKWGCVKASTEPERTLLIGERLCPPDSTGL